MDTLHKGDNDDDDDNNNNNLGGVLRVQLKNKSKAGDFPEIHSSSLYRYLST